MKDVGDFQFKEELKNMQLLYLDFVKNPKIF